MIDLPTTSPCGLGQPVLVPNMFHGYFSIWIYIIAVKLFPPAQSRVETELDLLNYISNHRESWTEAERQPQTSQFARWNKRV